MFPIEVTRNGEADLPRIRKVLARIAVVGLAMVATLAVASPAKAASTWLVNRGSGLCLGVAGSSKANGAALIQWDCNAVNDDQQWVWDYQYTDNGKYVYVLKNLLSKKCLAVGGGSTANGAKAIQWSCNGNDEQKWKFDSDLRLRNINSDLCLAIPDASRTQGVQAVQWTCKAADTNPEQSWIHY
jgi:Ricin-type beta-trefoil lectin domain